MSETSSPKRPRMDYDDGKEEHYEKFNKSRDQDDQSFSKPKRKRDEIDEDDGKDEEKSKSVIETARREHTLVMRLTNKEQELQECMNQIQEMKQAQTQNTAQLRSMLLDPAINLVFQRMAKEMDEHKEKLKQKQNELSAWKFTPDSQTGMRLMAKCRMLLQENGDLGKMISSGRTAKLEGEIALHKALVTEMKQNQKELDEFVGELEEDVEGMQGMIFMLQQQLKEAREQVARLSHENEQLRTLSMPPDPEPGGNDYDNAGSTPDRSNFNPKPTPDSNQKSSVAVPTSVSDSRSKKTSPVTSSLSRTSVQKDAVYSEEDMNGGSGFLCFKATPDSGMYTLEDDASQDNTEISTQNSQLRTHEGSSDKNVTSSSSSNCNRKQTSSNPTSYSGAPSSPYSTEQTADSTAGSSTSRLSNGCKHLSDVSDSSGRHDTKTIDSGKVVEKMDVETTSIKTNNEVTCDSMVDGRTKDGTMDPEEKTSPGKTSAGIVQERLSERTDNLQKQDDSITEGKAGEVSEGINQLTLVNGASE